jgi:hypothetical protein
MRAFHNVGPLINTAPWTFTILDHRSSCTMQPCCAAYCSDVQALHPPVMVIRSHVIVG